MNILLIGGGGREHAIASALHRSESLSKLYCSPGNPGIFALAENANVNTSNFYEIIEFCKNYSIDLVVVGPEQPLANGIADALITANIKVFGPSKKAAQLEASKGFAKEFMQRYNIPTADFRTFTSDNADEAHSYIDSQSHPIVLKADGLAAGKGVIISQSADESHEVLDSMFAGLFGDASKTVVIEEFLIGEEASILAVSDGRDLVTLASSQDHKRALDGDRGKNTGGMGVYSPAPIINNNVLEIIHSSIIIPTIKGMADEGSPFVGCLYAGLMIHNGEPKVVEFNVRFGDPETQAVLSIFKGDFAKLLYSAASGAIDKSTVTNIQDGCACCVILASEGYPGSYDKGFQITGINDAENNGAIVYHSGTVLKDGNLITSGGRVLGVTAIGEDLQQAIDKSYEAVEKINFENKYFRTDIGAKGLIKLSNK